MYFPRELNKQEANYNRNYDPYEEEDEEISEEDKRDYLIDQAYDEYKDN